MSAAEIRSSKAEELRIVRQPLPRHDQQEKIAGSTRYAGDLAFASMLHARLVRAPMPSAEITRRDGSAAAAVPGVVLARSGTRDPNPLSGSAAIVSPPGGSLLCDRAHAVLPQRSSALVLAAPAARPVG